MAYKLLVTPEAKADIVSAASWYDEKRHRFGDIYLLAVQDVFASISRHPEMYPVIVDDIRRAIFSHFPYAALYRSRGEKLEILAVLHHKQHPDNMLSRLKSEV